MIGPTCNDMYLVIQKAAKNRSKTFKTIKRVKGLMSLLSGILRKFVPYTGDSQEIIMPVLMLLHS